MSKYGSSHEKLGWIANVELLQDKLEDFSRSWAPCRGPADQGSLDKGATSRLFDIRRRYMAFPLDPRGHNGTELKDRESALRMAQLVQTVSNMSRGAPPRLGMEGTSSRTPIVGATSALTATRRQARERPTNRFWEELKGTDRTATQGGVRAACKAVQKEARTKRGYGTLRSYMYVDAGLSRAGYLQLAGKSDTKACTSLRSPVVGVVAQDLSGKCSEAGRRKNFE
ncbi:hypothetical protein L211DRAFT_847840 [Terfezia boudieri ATCC MYA-4762]|uniref:Uncharacterized protein n=1 Tax=Terfezia boudieri ATCC MYA-4762 TaxID=1051890 RepID=A0A3N4LRD8_9PEZI|nr:hypothetical protein L211DRAFT_847840 [Terfezia boudieri ATCC MYA-4762]